MAMGDGSDNDFDLLDAAAPLDGVSALAAAGVTEAELDALPRSVINPAELHREVTRIAALIAWVGERHADAAGVAATRAVEARAAAARAYLEARAPGTLGAAARRTVDELNALVDCDAGVLAARLAQVEAETAARRLAGRLEALQARRRMLSELCQDARAERRGEPWEGPGPRRPPNGHA